MFERMKSWYNGELVIEPDEPNSPFVFPLMYQRYHWTAKLARIVASFYLRHWQWVWGTVIGVASLWVAVLSMKS